MLCLGLALGALELGCVVPTARNATWQCGSSVAQPGEELAEGTQCKVDLPGCSTTLLQTCMNTAWVGLDLSCPIVARRLAADDEDYSDDSDDDSEDDTDTDIGADDDDDDDGQQEIVDLMAPGLCACWQSRNGLPDFPGCLPCKETKRDGGVERTQGCQAALGPRRCDAAQYCGLQGIPGCDATPEPTTAAPQKVPKKAKHAKCDLELIEGSSECMRPKHYGCVKKNRIWVKQGCAGLFACNGKQMKCFGKLPGKTFCRCNEGPFHGHHGAMGPPPPPPPPPPPRDDPDGARRGSAATTPATRPGGPMGPASPTRATSPSGAGAQTTSSTGTTGPTAGAAAGTPCCGLWSPSAFVAGPSYPWVAPGGVPAPDGCPGDPPAGDDPQGGPGGGCLGGTARGGVPGVDWGAWAAPGGGGGGQAG
eukprot:CAMPEP_0204311924 /NCGR_PEP_ID=MMETSP0469-20131031/2649_1 /ASSEMBLY_ACC=CAM_ASM_000384 /TAXON_ID=2969 /ORGANISM="Oxyrrhis marina" /LENGTH=420 /DNA_ID=CAMNT_0051291955 /DNA_START=40 /DNA_END=1300 /DNA_ORIENTATION=+